MESKRIRKFKSSLVKEIPFFPNNKETRDGLLRQSLLPLILHYLHWKARYVPKRSRAVLIDNEVLNGERYSCLKSKIDKVLTDVNTGNDLKPYLSSKVQAKGYTPDTNNDKWADKDFLLNITGFHHFHLEKYPRRTKEVLFARVSRQSFHVVGIFDHSVFESDSDDNASLNGERSRLWHIFDEFTSRGLPSDSVYLPYAITTSGHPLHVVDMASHYNEIVMKIEPKLEDREFVTDIYGKSNIKMPKNNKLSWHVLDLDLGFLDKENNFFLLKYGPC